MPEALQELETLMLREAEREDLFVFLCKVVCESEEEE